MADWLRMLITTWNKFFANKLGFEGMPPAQLSGRGRRQAMPPAAILFLRNQVNNLQIAPSARITAPPVVVVLMLTGFLFLYQQRTD